MKTNLTFEFYSPKNFEPNMAQLRLRCLLPFLYTYCGDYVITGDSVMLTSQKAEIPKCNHEWCYFLNILPEDLKHLFTDDMSNRYLFYLEPEYLEFLKKYFATTGNSLDETQKFALCGNDEGSLNFLELIAKCISQFKFHYAFGAPHFMQIPGNFAREVLEKIPPSPELAVELWKINTGVGNTLRKKSS